MPETNLLMNPQAHNKQSFFTHALVLTLSLALTFLSYLVGEELIRLHAYQSQTKDAKRFLEVAESIADNAIETLVELNALPQKECDDKVLLEMRRRIFKNRYLKDLGMFKEEFLICTTGLGRLNAEIVEPPPNYSDDSGVELWANRKLLFFEQAYESVLIRISRFNAVVDPQDLKELISNDYHYEVVFNHNKKVIHILGEPNLYLIPHSSTGTGKLLAYSSCSNEIPFCIALQLEEDVFYRNYLLAFIGLLIVCALFFILCYGGGRFYFFRRYSISTRIARGLKKHRFYADFQPIVELESQKIVGCEVLARFRDSRGSIPPDKFIPIILKNHNTWAFTEKMIKHSIALLNKQVGLPEKFKVSFNIFPQDIANGSVEKLHKITGLTDKFTIGLEITEDQALDVNASADALGRLMESGFTIAIDDFGTGYSNLNQLKHLTCESLKIDRSFVNDMEDDSIRSSLIPHIVSIAEKLNLSVIAEGIENAQQANALIKAGIKYGQGWHFGKPMSAAKIAILIASKN